MRDPKRILEKILGDGKDLDRLEETGESLEQLAEVLRDVVRCRRTRRWITKNYGIDIVVFPATFTHLLEIPQINFIENSNRILEVDTVSLKETRNLGRLVKTVYDPNVQVPLYFSISKKSKFIGIFDEFNSTLKKMVDEGEIEKILGRYR